ncbi:hypothetical protein PMIN04_005493 [Paraphaeosphaeria minitans]
MLSYTRFPCPIFTPGAVLVSQYLMFDHTIFHSALNGVHPNARHLRTLHGLRAATCPREAGYYFVWTVHHNLLDSIYSAWIDSPLDLVKPDISDRFGPWTKTSNSWHF